MIELYFKNNVLKKVNSIQEVMFDEDQIFNIRIIDFTDVEIKEIAEKFKLDVTIFNRKEDIEISSHYLTSTEQVSLNFLIPAYKSESLYEEVPIVIIIKNEVVFNFLSSNIDHNFLNLTKTRYDSVSINFTSYLEHFVFQIGIISDYYADLTELMAIEIKKVYANLVQSESFDNSDLDLIMQLNFNNHIINESISNFRRILKLFVRSKFEKSIIRNKLKVELEDVAVIADHLQYNFERLDDLKENISSKIDLEQNKIFKTLTVLTVCISLPTLIAGVYGMNFNNMPELTWKYGYPIIVGCMLISFICSLIYFTHKNWIK